MKRVNDPSKRIIGIKLLWSWDYRFWSWFDSHGIESAYYGAKHEEYNCHKCDAYQGYRMSVEPIRVFDTVYHLGPFKIFIGVLK